MTEVLRIWPQAGVPGSLIIIECRGFDASDYAACDVLFGETPGRIVGASPDRLLVAVPDELTERDRFTGVQLVSAGKTSARVPFFVAERLAENLHPVANPAYDPETGAIFTTISGARGKKVEVSVWRIGPDGKAAPFLDNIMNPTGMTVDREGTLYITSRHDGTLYRVSPFREVVPFAENLGIATGLAIDRSGNLFVGDRQGTIYRVTPLGDVTPHARLEPSMAAYHLAFAPDGNLYVTAPTAAGTREAIYRVTPMGKVEPWFVGLGRPQGLAFDQAGNAYVCASLDGLRGVIKITPDAQEAELFIAGMRLVGLVFDDKGTVILASNHEIYRVSLGVVGYDPNRA
ncbi:MAG: SMP-30/gluconolactonase/LRE family protein [Chloracidobacterium sp.]|uniref:SMP-30/gluconolactonase/LRE family protein n=1 Tax=Chloracidobacterium validum TaxID=2821543 RepID=A0ABX8BDQ4_9BACT|nr:SMP-30/gluconolactonase/LRE family protein [Chloracidobacterium validum]QUW04547.1 SMP-30/gluconolactonase/LRE family protein [Chloracidobacterium validum]